ncbi:MAG: helix-turn-helix transcriptional regulator [Gemmatimonadetes bacterium]|nr:helix-turn-helix transcriptional regulator [Gemmatimonadota bacterium]
MALLAAIARDRALAERLQAALAGLHEVAWVMSWRSFMRLVRERPVTGSLVDMGIVAGDGPGTVVTFRAWYPRTGLVLLGSFHRRPADLFRLGRGGVDGIVLLGVEDPGVHLRSAVAASLRNGVVARVMRVLSRRVPRRELEAVHLALEGVHRAWSADEFAERLGVTRPVLSERFRGVGLPSVGRLLLWVRVLHACSWLTEPGRTAESVSRQLEYSSGAAFRRALRLCTGATPTQVIERGGLDLALERFQDRLAPRPVSAWVGAQDVA